MSFWVSTTAPCCITVSASHTWLATREIVAHQHVSQAALAAQAPEQVQHLGLAEMSRADVGSSGRTTSGSMISARGDGDPLPLPSRDLVGIAEPERGVQTDLGERRGRSDRRSRRAGAPARARRGSDRRYGVEGEPLRIHAPIACEEPEQRAARSGIARARLADDTELLAPEHEAHPSYRFDGTARGIEGDAEIFGDEQRR